MHLEDRYRVGIVYFISDGEYIKIGYTFNLLDRLASLQCGNAKTLFVKDKYYCQFPFEEEQYLHKKYKNQRMRGEWFNIA